MGVSKLVHSTNVILLYVKKGLVSTVSWWFGSASFPSTNRHNILRSGTKVVQPFSYPQSYAEETFSQATVQSIFVNQFCFKIEGAGVETDSSGFEERSTFTTSQSQFRLFTRRPILIYCTVSSLAKGVVGPLITYLHSYSR
jgi:hypothetical protein